MSDERAGYDVRIPARFIEQNPTLNQFRTYCAIRTIQLRGGGTCFNTMAEIGKVFSKQNGRPLMTKGNVSEAVSWLVEHGWAVRTSGGGLRVTRPLADMLVDDFNQRVYPLPIDPSAVPESGTEAPNEDDEGTSVPESGTNPPPNGENDDSVPESGTHNGAEPSPDVPESGTERSGIRNDSLYNPPLDPPTVASKYASTTVTKEGDDEHKQALQDIPVPFSDSEKEMIPRIKKVWDDLQAIGAAGTDFESLTALYRRTFSVRANGRIGAPPRGAEVLETMKAHLRRWPWSWLVCGYYVTSSKERTSIHNVEAFMEQWEKQLEAKDRPAGELNIGTAPQDDLPAPGTIVNAWKHDRLIEQGVPKSDFGTTSPDSNNKPRFIYKPRRTGT